MVQRECLDEARQFGRQRLVVNAGIVVANVGLELEPADHEADV
jgi:hypothetical protein